MPTGKNKYPLTGVAIKPELKAKIKELAAIKKMNFNMAVEQALEDWLDANDR